MPDAPPHEVIPAVGRAIVEAMDGRVGLLLRIVFELLHGDPDTTEGMGSSVARETPAAPARSSIDRSANPRRPTSSSAVSRMR